MNSAWILTAASACFLSLPCAAGVLDLDLGTVEASALSHSAALRSSRAEAAAGAWKEEAQWTELLPHLQLDGDQYYLTHVPEENLLGYEFTLGYHDNYSWGATAAWDVFDGFKNYNTAKSLAADAEGLRQTARDEERQLVLQARVDYFQTQLAAESARQLADSLKLAQSEARDVEVRLKDGDANRSDLASAKSEVLQRTHDYRAARTDLAVQLRELLALTGLGGGLDPSVPEDDVTAQDPPQGVEPGTLTVRLERLDTVGGTWQGAGAAPLKLDQPQILALRQTAEAARLNVEAQRAGHWPTVQVSARSSVDDPESLLNQPTEQNTFTVSATWPLFAFGQVQKKVAEQEARAVSQQAKLEQAESDLTRDWEKAEDRLKGLRDQKTVDAQAVDVSRTYYQLAEASYKDGDSSLLEVQSAAQKVVESQVRLATTQAQMLIELATLASLSE